MSLYRSIIKQAFITAWQHKYLWFFGLFATLLASNFEIELVNRFINRGTTPYDWQRWADTGIFTPQAWSNFLEIARTDTFSFVSIILVLLILAALLIGLLWISIVSQIALVSNTNKALANGAKQTAAERRHDTSVGFQEGRKYFWPVLWLNVLVRVIAYGLAALTLVPVLFQTAPGLGLNLLYLALFIIFLTLALSIALIAKYAIAAVVIKRQSFGNALAASWNLFWNNWLTSLEMAFILFALSILASLAIIIAVLVLAIPLALLYILTFAFGSPLIFAIILGIGVITSIAVVVIGGSIITVVQTSAWVALYNQLSSKGTIVSKLERTFGKNGK